MIILKYGEKILLKISLINAVNIITLEDFSEGNPFLK
jgi:hypothetical protein